MNNQPLTGKRLVWATIALAMATFMQVLDSTIANVAIPTISGNLGASVSQGTWVITSFGVSNAISIAITGFLAKRFGEVRVFIWSVGLFTLASLLCGLSDSLGMLIFFRVLQGGVAGPIIPLSQSLLLKSYPPAKRNTALALWSMTIILAPVCGPIMGGYISDNFHWGWIFFINIPIGISVVIVSLMLLRGMESKTTKVPLNVIGLSLLIVGIGCLQILLDKGKDLGWLESDEIVALAVIAAVALVFLVIWELTDKNPIVELSLFKSRNFTIGTLSVSLAYMVYFGAIVLLPQLLQEVYGYTAEWAGLALAPIGLVPILISAFVGKISNVVDLRWIVTFSFVIYAICFYWRAYTFEPQMDFYASVWPQLVQGFAVACFFMPLTTITLSGLPPEKLASASALANFFRTLAGSIGTSITTTLWSRRESLHHSQLTESITEYNPESVQMYQEMAQHGMSQIQTSAYLAKEITAQGLIISANEIFWLSGGVFIGLIVLVWFAKPPFTAKS